MRLYVAAGRTGTPTDHVMFTFGLDASAALEGPGDVVGAADAETVAAAGRPLQ
jgi:hypothetical protein